MKTTRDVLLILLPVMGAMLCAGCVPSQTSKPVVFADRAPHPLPPILRERTFDGSLYGEAGLGNLAADYVALGPGDPIVIRLDPENGFPGVPQKGVTLLMGQVVRVDSNGSLLVTAQRTIRDISGVRKVVLVGRVYPESIESGNVVPASLVSMLRFRADGPSDKGESPNFVSGAQKNPKRPVVNGGIPGTKTRGKGP